jgi:phosphatidylethanolamine-binding protein (PEBP) family uncharacterized protein
VLCCFACACSSEGHKTGNEAAAGAAAASASGGGGTSTVSTGGSNDGGGTHQVGGSAAAGAGGSSGTSAAGAGGSPAGAGAGGGGGGGEPFILTSSALENVTGCSVDNPSVCDVFAAENVSYMDSANVSPELHWTGAPPGTQSLALVLFDVTFGQAHWVLWNIPADATGLAANVSKDTATPPTPAGSRQANANFATTGGDGYFGPHVPCNVFEFELYALSTSTFSPMAPDSSVLVSIELQELGDAVLGVAKLTGRGGACE